MVDALTSDCRVLLARFEEKLSVRFETFCEVWKEINFSLIHYVRTREWERIQIVECLFRILSNYLLSSCPLQYQVGAIYAIFSIYNTQLVKPKVKIRMTLSMWKNLLDLQEKVKEQKHCDVHYVICFLKADKAFLFVAMPIQLACGSRDAISVYERELTKDTKPSNAIQNVLETLQRVEKIDSMYNSLKQKICSPDVGEPSVDPVTLRVASDQFASHLQRDVSEFQTWQQANNKESIKTKRNPRRPELGLPEDRKSSSDIEKENPDEALDRSEKVRAIKHRSYNTVTQVSKSTRHLQPVGAAGKTTRKTRRKSRKK